jgi:hypothetical protein
MGKFSKPHYPWLWQSIVADQVPLQQVTHHTVITIWSDILSYNLQVIRLCIKKT